MFDTSLDIHRPPTVAVGCFMLHNAALLETQAPGPGLGALLDELDPLDLDMHDLVSHIGACGRQIAWTEARQLAAVRELSGRQLVPGRNGAPADSPFSDGMINEYAADEVAAVLTMPRV